MKYTTEIEIKQPIDKVVSLFDNPANMNKWMKGLQSFELLSGTQGQPGAKAKLKFKIGKREIEMIETITVRKLPNEFSGTYEAKGVFNTVKNKFYSVSENTTKYITENEFEFRGFMKIIAFIMPNAFRKQTLKTLNDFKIFVENQK